MKEMSHSASYGAEYWGQSLPKIAFKFAYQSIVETFIQSIDSFCVEPRQYCRCLQAKWEECRCIKRKCSVGG